MLDYSDDVRAEEVVVIAEYNSLLASNLANFTASNAGVTADIINTTTAFQTVIDDPQAYGAANATCYDDDGTTCVWYNNYHPAIASKLETPLFELYYWIMLGWSSFTDCILQFTNLSLRRLLLHGRPFSHEREAGTESIDTQGLSHVGNHGRRKRDL